MKTRFTHHDDASRDRAYLRKKYLSDILATHHENDLNSVVSRLNTDAVSLVVDYDLEIYKELPQEAREIFILERIDAADENFKMFRETGDEDYRTKGTLSARIAAELQARIKTIDDTSKSIAEEFRTNSANERIESLSFLEREAEERMRKYKKTGKIRDLRQSQLVSNFATSLRRLIEELDS